MTATIQDVKQVGEKAVVTILWSDNSIQEFTFDIPISVGEIRSSLQQEVNRRNSVAGQINSLRNLIGVELK